MNNGYCIDCDHCIVTRCHYWEIHSCRANEFPERNNPVTGQLERYKSNGDWTDAVYPLCDSCRKPGEPCDKFKRRVEPPKQPSLWSRLMVWYGGLTK